MAAVPGRCAPRRTIEDPTQRTSAGNPMPIRVATKNRRRWTWRNIRATLVSPSMNVSLFQHRTGISHRLHSGPLQSRLVVTETPRELWSSASDALFDPERMPHEPGGCCGGATHRGASMTSPKFLKCSQGAAECRMYASGYQHTHLGSCAPRSRSTWGQIDLQARMIAAFILTF